MTMFKHILVPLDGSEQAERALAYARELVQATGARLTLLTVILRFQHSLPRIEHLEETSRRLALDYLEPVAEKLPAGVRCDLRVTFGEPAEAITTLARDENVDLIVMSTHGTGATGRDALGSVALKVLRTAPCPVTMVRIGA